MLPRDIFNKVIDMKINGNAKINNAKYGCIEKNVWKKVNEDNY